MMQRGGGGMTALHRRAHGVEVARSHLPLVLDGGEAFRCRRELRFLELDERLHVVARIAVREVEHRVVEAVESGERDELESIAHGAELALEAPDRRVVEILAPVERR